jgi:hypothetical protein
MVGCLSVILVLDMQLFIVTSFPVLLSFSSTLLLGPPPVPCWHGPKQLISKTSLPNLPCLTCIPCQYGVGLHDYPSGTYVAASGTCRQNSFFPLLCNAICAAHRAGLFYLAVTILLQRPVCYIWARYTGGSICSCSSISPYYLLHLLFKINVRSTLCACFSGWFSKVSLLLALSSSEAVCIYCQLTKQPAFWLWYLVFPNALLLLLCGRSVPSIGLPRSVCLPATKQLCRMRVPGYLACVLPLYCALTPAGRHVMQFVGCLLAEGCPRSDWQIFLVTH